MRRIASGAGGWVAGIAAVIGLALAGCADDEHASEPAAVEIDAPTTSTTPTTVVRTVPMPTPATSSIVPTTIAETAPTSAPAVTTVLTTVVATSPTTTAAPTTLPAPTGTSYQVPVESSSASWGTTHSGYPATDVFVGCGAVIVSPVNGTLADVRREDRWDPAVDNPATRGGKSIAIIGDDGVRYYLAHFDSIEDALASGVRVAVGQRLGLMGETGRASACHLHFAISAPCPGPEWAVRRGVIWPFPYLDAWREGEQRSPADEVAGWATANPTACHDAMADPNADDS